MIRKGSVKTTVAVAWLISYAFCKHRFTNAIDFAFSKFTQTPQHAHAKCAVLLGI